MIFDARKHIKYTTNKETLGMMGMETKDGDRPTYVYYKGHENEFVVWFNYEAFQNEHGEWENPSDNNYANIYSEDDSEIEEIVPINKSFDSKDDNHIVINFKKFEKNELYFTGLYVVTKRVNRSVFLKRISYTFNTDNIYLIEPTDDYCLLKNNKEDTLFSKNINKLITEVERDRLKQETREAKLKNNLKTFENQIDDKLNYDLMDEDDEDEYKPVEPKIEFDISAHNSYKRNRQIGINAIFRNGRKCEIDNNHKLFFKKDNRKYIEVHHIIPMSAQKDFDIPLDREENIACLCPMCHREIHYGRNSKQLLEKLLLKHNNSLKEVGLDLSIDELNKYY